MFTHVFNDCLKRFRKDCSTAVVKHLHKTLAKQLVKHLAKQVARVLHAFTMIFSWKTLEQLIVATKNNQTSTRHLAGALARKTRNGFLQTTLVCAAYIRCMHGFCCPTPHPSLHRSQVWYEDHLLQLNNYDLTLMRRGSSKKEIHAVQFPVSQAPAPAL